MIKMVICLKMKMNYKMVKIIKKICRMKDKKEMKNKN